MRRVRRCARQAEILRFQRITEVYAPYVQVRCVAFTNSRQASLEIGAYVLLCTCLITRIVGDRGSTGVLVEAMLEVVGPDVMVRGWWRDDEGLVPEGPMLELARALNRIERSSREILILTWLGGRTPREVARLLGKPAAATEMDLSRAEETLATQLGCGLGDARDRLHEFTAGLDVRWIMEVGCGVMELLTPEFEQASELTGSGRN
jgi:hypothetical protein